jgi:signal transduction histidine kinase
MNVTAFPLKDQSGHVYNVVISYTDMTESYLVQQQLTQIDKLKSIGTLTSGVAHDFNNILGAIVPNADLIIHMATNDEEVRKKAQAIKTASKRAAALTQQLVSFSRETHGDKRALDLNNCVREAVELIGNAIPKNVSIDFEPAHSLKPVIADPLQMQQVLINLIINASDATPNGGIIEIRTGEEYLRNRTTFGGNIIPPGWYSLLSVKDRGVGIPKELVDRVFDPFFTTKEKGRGTGLGLSVVHGIVKSHRGLINISTEQDKGTLFDVYLPAATGDDSDDKL